MAGRSEPGELSWSRHRAMWTLAAVWMKIASVPDQDAKDVRLYLPRGETASGNGGEVRYRMRLEDEGQRVSSICT